MRSRRARDDGAGNGDGDGDGGMVTAELAACLPVLVFVLGLAMAVLAVTAARMRVVDAAREAARVAARSDDATARRLVGEIAPGARLSLRHSTAETVAVVRLAVRPLTRVLPAVTVVARAVAATEPAPLGSSP